MHSVGPETRFCSETNLVVLQDLAWWLFTGCYKRTGPPTAPRIPGSVTWSEVRRPPIFPVVPGALREKRNRAGRGQQCPQPRASTLDSCLYRKFTGSAARVMCGI